MTLYREMDRAALDAAYNNSAAVTNSSAFMAELRARGDRLRAEMPQHLDLRYGPAPRNRIDYFSASARGPVLMFIHGGYWQMRAKEDFSALARGPLAHGIDVAMIGYTLAPDISLSGIVAEIRAAIRWLAAHADEHGGDARPHVRLRLVGRRPPDRERARRARDQGRPGHQRHLRSRAYALVLYQRKTEAGRA
jgi:acetyl esterase/lipase